MRHGEILALTVGWFAGAVVANSGYPVGVRMGIALATGVLCAFVFSGYRLLRAHNTTTERDDG